jgi:hypothetical protein
MSTVKNSHTSTVEDYLNGELISEVKHFIEGYIYAMAVQIMNAYQEIYIEIW